MNQQIKVSDEEEESLSYFSLSSYEPLLLKLISRNKDGDLGNVLRLEGAVQVL